MITSPGHAHELAIRSGMFEYRRRCSIWRSLSYLQGSPSGAMWNTIRMTRLLLNEMIHESLAKVRSDSGCDTIPNYSSLRDHHAKLARDIAMEILASVPQFTQFSPNRTKLFPPTVASICFLIWPLEVVGTSALSTWPMRVYVMSRSRYMGAQMNIRQALDVAEKAGARVPVTGLASLTLALLGCHEGKSHDHTLLMAPTGRMLTT